MPRSMPRPDLELTLHAGMAEIDAAEWAACGGDHNPFTSHAFLSAIEDSGSTGRRTGWIPRHAALRDRSGRLVAAAPMYVKGHSYGEYVFDHGWAQAFEQAGGNYYPKLQIASPFSPVTGPRLLVRPESGLSSSILATALAETVERLELSSAHVTFCTEAEWHVLGEAGWLRRTGTQFHWHNDGYADFQAFLGALSSRKRKSIRRERRDANAAGLDFKTLRGAQITPAHWAAFYEFYTSTVDRKWGSAYLTEGFFPLLSARLGERVVLMLAEHDGAPVAGALNLMSADMLYGRNWGVRGDWPFLHFELCYYRAIDFAIAHGLRGIEAGAQGEHKLQRGYTPQPTYSAHWIRHPGLRQAVAVFVAEERAAQEDLRDRLNEDAPFRQNAD